MTEEDGFGPAAQQKQLQGLSARKNPAAQVGRCRPVLRACGRHALSCRPSAARHGRRPSQDHRRRLTACRRQGGPAARHRRARSETSLPGRSRFGVAMRQRCGPVLERPDSEPERHLHRFRRRQVRPPARAVHGRRTRPCRRNDQAGFGGKRRAAGFRL